MPLPTARTPIILDMVRTGHGRRRRLRPTTGEASLTYDGLGTHINLTRTPRERPVHVHGGNRGVDPMFSIIQARIEALRAYIAARTALERCRALPEWSGHGGVGFTATETGLGRTPNSRISENGRG
jgi:hypothetical protein